MAQKVSAPGDGGWKKSLAQFSFNDSSVPPTRAGVTLVAAGPRALCREGRRAWGVQSAQNRTQAAASGISSLHSPPWGQGHWSPVRLCSLPGHPAPCNASRPCRPFLLNQHFQRTGSVSFSFLLPEKSCRHEIIFNETYFHLSSPLRSLGLPHPPSHSQVSSCAPTQYHPLWVPSRTSPIPHTAASAFPGSRSLLGSWADVQQCSVVLPLGSVPPAPPPWHLG